MHKKRYEIDRSKSFKTLEHAPIVEAVVEIRCLTEVPWTEETIPKEVEKRLPGYQLLDSQSEFKQVLRLKDSGPVAQSAEKMRWKGVRYRSKDERYISAFNHDSFVFSRVGSYRTWAEFRDEALRGWDVHKSIAKPTHILRIGLRYINRIRLPGGAVDLDEFIYPGPQPPRDLPFPIKSFLHKDSFDVPGNPYVVNRVFAPAVGSEGGYEIILDIDVYIQQKFETDDNEIQKYLEDMRVLKNEVFWGSIPPKLLQNLQGDT